MVPKGSRQIWVHEKAFDRNAIGKKWIGYLTNQQVKFLLIQMPSLVLSIKDLLYFSLKVSLKVGR